MVGTGKLDVLITSVSPLLRGWLSFPSKLTLASALHSIIADTIIGDTKAADVKIEDTEIGNTEVTDTKIAGMKIEHTEVG